MIATKFQNPQVFWISPIMHQVITKTIFQVKREKKAADLNWIIKHYSLSPQVTKNVCICIASNILKIEKREILYIEAV